MDEGAVFVFVTPVLSLLIAAVAARLPKNGVIGVLLGLVAGITVFYGIWFALIDRAAG